MPCSRAISISEPAERKAKEEKAQLSGKVRHAIGDRHNIAGDAASIAPHCNEQASKGAARAVLFVYIRNDVHLHNLYIWMCIREANDVPARESRRNVRCALTRAKSCSLCANEALPRGTRLTFVKLDRMAARHLDAVLVERRLEARLLQDEREVGACATRRRDDGEARTDERRDKLAINTWPARGVRARVPLTFVLVGDDLGRRRQVADLDAEAMRHDAL